MVFARILVDMTNNEPRIMFDMSKKWPRVIFGMPKNNPRIIFDMSKKVAPDNCRHVEKPDNVRHVEKVRPKTSKMLRSVCFGGALSKIAGAFVSTC